MQRYDFEVLGDERVLYRETAVMLPQGSVVWNYAQNVAEKVTACPHMRLRVTDDVGRIVILVGVSPKNRSSESIA